MRDASPFDVAGIDSAEAGVCARLSRSADIWRLPHARPEREPQCRTQRSTDDCGDHTDGRRRPRTRIARTRTPSTWTPTLVPHRFLAEGNDPSEPPLVDATEHCAALRRLGLQPGPSIFPTPSPYQARASILKKSACPRWVPGPWRSGGSGPLRGRW